MMQEDQEMSDFQGKYLMPLLSASISTKFQFGLIIQFFHVGINIFLRQKIISLMH